MDGWFGGPRLSRALGCGLVAAILAGGCQALGQGSGGPPLPGRIAWPKDGDLWVIELSNRQARKITDLPRGAAVTGAAWSPDGARLVYSEFSRRPGEKASGADLVTADADGGNTQPFAERDDPATVLEEPDWAASGRVYYTTRHVQARREQTAIVRQTEGGAPETVLDNAYHPGVAPDESSIVYVRSTRAGQALWRKPLGEPGDGCELVPDSEFQAVGLPRVSPDGKRVAFGASGEPSSEPGTCGGAAGQAAGGEDGETRAAPGPGALLADWLGVLPRPALAHGLPWDIWTVNWDGSQLTKVADLKEDDPTVAWAPDGGQLAVFGVAALYVVDARGGGSPQKIVDQGGYGGLDWTR